MVRLTAILYFRRANPPMKQWLLLLFVSFSVLVSAQQKSTFSGHVIEAESGEPIIGATIVIDSLKAAAATDNKGFFSVTVPSGMYLVRISAFGLEPDTLAIDLNNDYFSEFELAEEVNQIDEIIVEGRKSDNTTSTKLGQAELKIEQIKKIPAFLGEVDIIRAIQTLPGVSSVSEGGQGFYVRGGGPDQNLVLLDDATVYNASHLFGFFSVFNSDAIKGVNLIKGGMPANYGGRLSSVLEVTQNDGNNKKLRVTGGLGILSSRLTIEGPLVKNKGSFIISGRRTYIDLLMKAFVPKTSGFYGSSYFFYDFNTKFSYKLSKKDKISFSSYYGRDKFIFNNADDFNVQMPWGNAVAALKWTHQFNPKLTLNVSGTFTDYQFSFGSVQDNFSFELKSGIRDYGSRIDFRYAAGTRHTIQYGVEYTHHTFTPIGVSAKQDSVDFDTGLAQKLYSHESAVYFLDEFDVTEKLRINVGLRYSFYQFVGPFTRYVKGIGSASDSTITYSKNDLIKAYSQPEPRIAVRYLFKNKSSVKAGWSYNNQYVHLTSLSAVSLPTDIWYPTTDKAKPQRGWQATAGYFRNFSNNRWETSVEVYYKQMSNLIEYAQGALPTDNVNDNTDNLLVYGKGWSYGVEFFVKRTFGKLTGWLGYTLAKTNRLFPDIQATKFPAKYDRRHDLSIVASYDLNKRWTFGANFVFATGNTLTLPTSWYLQGQDLLFNYGSRNSTRMASYHRLDLSATLYDKPTKTVIDKETGKSVEVKKKFRWNLNFSIYNVYSRANPYFLYIDNSGDVYKGTFKITVKQVSLFPILPAVTWNFEF